MSREGQKSIIRGIKRNSQIFRTQFGAKALTKSCSDCSNHTKMKSCKTLLEPDEKACIKITWNEKRNCKIQTQDKK